jgi:ubiquinol-cytochrome c reductase iron-sulfur subunit
MALDSAEIPAEGIEDPSRRDFMVLAASGLGVVGACTVAWPLIDSMNPSEDVLAQSSVEIDISNIEPGTQKKAIWRGKPVFIYRRTPEQIAQAKKVPLSDLKDPQTDEERTKPGKEEWLVMVGVCTHLGCIPIAGEGEFGGWFCPCHGSQYDISGRIRKGPAPQNLIIPPYAFLNDTTIKIG